MTTSEQQAVPVVQNEDEVDNLVRTVANWISFSSSCIKSGESWTATCETMKASAFKALDVLGNTNLATLRTDATQTREAELSRLLATATGIQSGPNGAGRMKVVIDGLSAGEEGKLHQFLSAALNARGGAA